MKKRKGASFPKALRHQSTSYSTPAIIRRARDFPPVECLISPDWQNENPGLVQIVVTRQQPDGDLCFGMYLIDKLCLGLKNTFARANYSQEHYHDEVLMMFQDREPKPCPAELAYQMIYEGIDYAGKFGFAPQKDFELTQNMLVPHDEVGSSYKLKFGKKGKPFFIAGPHDNVPAVLKQLEMTAGPGNYDYVVMAPSDMY